VDEIKLTEKLAGAPESQERCHEGSHRKVDESAQVFENGKKVHQRRRNRQRSTKLLIW
jgi:hypothetical protein